ncbi:MAG: hypothetical protein M1838_003020, partial [Thelocarpon superellum]
MDELRDWLKPVIINAFSEALKWKAQAPERAQVSRKRVYHDDGTTLKVVIGHKTLQPSRHVVQIHDFLHGGELHHARVSDSVTYVNAVIHGPALASAGQGDTLQSKPERSKGAYLWIRGLELLIRTGTKGDARVQLRISDAEHLGGAGDKLGGRPISIVAYPQTALLLHNLERLREPKTLGNTASETAETDNSPSHPTSQHRSAAGSATEAVETSTESQSALATQVPRTQARERSAASSVDDAQYDRDQAFLVPSNSDDEEPALEASVPLAINHLASSSLSEPPPGQGSGHTLTPTASSAMSERLVSTSLGELATPSPNRPLKDASVGLSPLSQLLEWLPSQTSHEAGHASNRTSMSDLLGHNGVQDINQRSASHARLGSPERGSPIRPAIEAEEEADHGACRGAKRKASSTEVFPLLKRAREERQRRSKSRVHEDGDEAKRSPGHGRWDGVSVRACIQDEAHGAPSRTPHHQGQSRPARIASPRPTRGARTNDLTIAAGSEKVTLYEKFQRAYPDYPAPLKTFVGSCAYVEWLVGEQQMEHRSLWDDFVYRQATDYPEWKAKRASRGQLEIPYETFYREEIDESMRTKRILSPNNLAEALELDPIAAGLMRYRTIPAI